MSISGNERIRMIGLYAAAWAGWLAAGAFLLLLLLWGGACWSWGNWFGLLAAAGLGCDARLRAGRLSLSMRRRSLGVCPACGNDDPRATGDRCPGCGATP